MHMGSTMEERKVGLDSQCLSYLSSWTKIFIYVMTSTLIDMRRTEPLLAEIPDKKDGLADAIHSRVKPRNTKCTPQVLQI